MGELSPDEDPHPREAQFGAVRWSDLLGAGRAQVLIWLRGLNLNLQVVVSSGIDIRALLMSVREASRSGRIASTIRNVRPPFVGGPLPR
jgi:hypothetical protein